jgi:anti-sigma regulatory factor (Ser/Thr protein kinase)
VHVVPLLIQVLDQLHITRRQRSEVFLILSELVSNALEHGLLGLDSSRKEAPDGVDAYFAARERGLAALSTGEIRIDLAAVWQNSEPVLTIAVSDTGQGFRPDPRLLSAEALGDGRRGGKGLALAKALCLEMRFNDTGNHVTVVYPLSPRRSPLQLAQ